MKYNIEIIISCYNEEKNIPILYKKIINSIEKSNKIRKYRLLYINDSSTDNTQKEIEKLKVKDKNIYLISTKKRIGKSSGIQKGFNNVKKDTDLVFMIDADLQDDPKELDRFIIKMEEGYDVVTGYKKNRLDNIEKKLASKLYNRIINFLFKMNIHDHNCGFKCFKYNVIKDIYIYDELHRFIMVISKLKGYKVSEIDVEHHKRKHGKSKYGLKRYFIGLKDIIRVKYILSVKNIKLNIIVNSIIIIILLLLGIIKYKWILLILVIYVFFYSWLLYNYHRYYNLTTRRKNDTEC